MLRFAFTHSLFFAGMLVVLLCTGNGVYAASIATTPDLVKVQAIKREFSHVITASNLSLTPVTVSLHLTNSSNLSSNRVWPVKEVIPPGQTVEMVEVYAVDKYFGYTFDFTHQVTPGDPQAHHDAGTSYLIPFTANQSFQILQSADGPIFSHNTAATRYAVDIVMPIGTTVVAARSGAVLGIVQHFEDNGKAEPAYFDRANYVRILHDDGSWADYFHLKQNSVKVNLGQRVEAGMAIALSGNSGYSTTPHLHFHVQVNQRGNIISLPFYFRNARDGVFTPRYQAWIAPDAASNVSAKPKARKSLHECLPAGKAIDDAVIRCLSSS
ncbi:M23 family metallopeptidase [Undibacterium sp. TJN19]|uniref:M23 family metallopeptidase n=1 Tax=Undibacterium sp. TJN19 TaxID=3413055 RepID=UPI003BF2E445